MSDDEDYDEYEDEDEDDEEDVERVEQEDDDYDFDTRVGCFEVYTCKCVGCEGKRHFRHNTRKWFAEKTNSGHAPVKCKPCNDWNREQEAIGPITVTCHYCPTTWQLSVAYRISYRRHQGRWDQDLVLCYRCEQYPGRKSKLEYKKAQKAFLDSWAQSRFTPEERYRREREFEAAQKKLRQHTKGHRKLSILLQENGLGAQSKSYDVPDALSFYENVRTPENKIHLHGPNRLTHIMKEAHGWKKQFGTDDAHSVLRIARHIAVSTEDHILQFQGRHSFVKYDTEHEVVALFERSDRSPTGYMLITVYQMDLSSVAYKVETKEWH